MPIAPPQGRKGKERSAVPLAALIVPEEAGEAMPAIRLFGLPLVEAQARLLRKAGAGHILLLAGRLDAALIESMDRLRADGIGIELVRTAREAADHLHPDESVLVLEGAHLPSMAVLDGVSALAPSILWTVPAGKRAADMRIDGGADWAGLALTSGAMVRDTAAMLGDWDLLPTLLRRLVQDQAMRLSVPDDGSMEPLAGAAAARACERRLLEPPSPAAGLGATLMNRLGTALAPRLHRQASWARHFGIGALAVQALGAAAALIGWCGAGLALLLLAACTRALAAPFGATGLLAVRQDALAAQLFPWSVALAIIATGWHSGAAMGDLAPLVLSLWLVSLLPAGHAPRLAHADATSASLLVLAGWMAGLPLIGLGIAVAHGLWSSWMIRRELPQLPA